jgi:methionyl aminopeptidase
MQDYLKAAECHKHIKSLILDYIKPELSYTELCNFIKKNITEYFGENNLNSGIAFPVGININNIVAHDSAYISDTRKIKNKDVIKIDYGTHVNGHIIDSAFTFSFVDDYDNLILATRDATDKAIKMAGVDVLLTDLTDEISEVIKSYELNLNNKTYNINPVYGIGGHNIKQYQIHGGKLILSRQPYPEENKDRMEEGEIYAIETFASTGSGNIYQDNTIPITHYMLNNSNNNNLKLKSSKKILNWIL